MRRIFVIIIFMISQGFSEIVDMGTIGKTDPVDLDAIDKINKEIEDAFSVEKLTAIYDAAMSSNALLEQEYKREREVVKQCESFTTSYAKRWEGQIFKEVRKDIDFKKIVPVGRKIFFFGATYQDYSSVKLMRSFPQGSIGFCVDYNAISDLERFSGAIEKNFVFTPIMNDDFLKELKVVTHYPCLITVLEEGYEIQFGI